MITEYGRVHKYTGTESWASVYVDTELEDTTEWQEMKLSEKETGNKAGHV